MEACGCPDGVCAAVDVHYLRTGGARAAAVLAADATFAHVLAARTAVLPQVPALDGSQGSQLASRRRWARRDSTAEGGRTRPTRAYHFSRPTA